MGVLEKPTFSLGFGLGKRCLISRFLWLGTKKQMKFLFLTMFYDVQFVLEILCRNMTLLTWSMWLSMWKRHVRQGLIKCVENISRIIWEWWNIWKKLTQLFLVPSPRYHDFRYIYIFNPKPKLKNGLSITPITA